MKNVKSLTNPGFALVATLSVLSLILIITLTLLSLATVVKRVNGHSYHSELAKANAKLALNQAIARLQEQMGPDTRVSANSSIINTTTQKHILGVWNSMGADSKEPNYFRDDGSILGEFGSNQNATYVDHRTPKFRRWLIPGAPQSDINYYVNAAANSSDITLLGEGTLGAGQTASHVTSPLIPIKESGDITGGYSWWITGENQKVRVALTSEVGGGTAGKIQSYLSAANTNPKIIPELSTYDKGEAQKHLTFNNVLFNKNGAALPSTAKKHFHTVSPYSVGLFTNTAKGGLKKDLNLVTELNSLHPDINKDVFVDGLPYSILRDHMRAYKANTNSGKIKWIGGVPHVSPGVDLHGIVAGSQWKDYMPMMSKNYMVLSLYAALDNSPGVGTWPDGSPKYVLRLYYNVIDEYWNPFSLPYILPRNNTDTGTHIILFKKLWSLPYAITYYKNGSLAPECDTDGRHLMAQLAAQYTTGGQIHNLRTRINRVLEPGEIRVFSDGLTSPTSVYHSIDMQEGWHISGGIYSEKLGNSGQKIHFKATDTVEPELFKTTDTSGFANYDYSKGWPPRDAPDNPPYFLDIFLVSAEQLGAHFMTEIYQNKESDGLRNVDSIASSIPRNGVNINTISSIDAPEKKKPFAILGIRRKTEKSITPIHFSPSLPSQTFKTKYFLHTNFLNQHFDAKVAGVSNNSGNVAHSPFVHFVQQVASFSDYPFLDVDINNKGYGGTSIGAQAPFAGQTNVVAIEIPFQPLLSMGQLQHVRLGVANANGINSHPTINSAIGNSFASPFNEADKFRSIRATYSGGIWVNPQTGFNTSGGWYNDKSFMLNEVFWDKWFMSSVTDQTNPYVDTALKDTTPQLLEKVITGSRNLPNTRYRFTSRRFGADATALKDALMTNDGFKNIAEHMVCPGAFNVNSTNVNAWKAFLTSLDGTTLARLKYNTNALENHNAQYYISRFSLPTEEPAETANFATNQQQFLNRRWQGARKLTGSEIDQLATAIVEQVKLRGPFLSLADFMNRQLRSSDPVHKRHLKGCLQAAIDNTSINASFAATSDTLSLTDVSSYGYPNPEAATGLVSEGAPGYITQADLVTPLASQLRVRDDTFVIRAYGESRENGIVIAKVYCEAVVQRGYEYVDPTNAPNLELLKVDGTVANTLKTINLQSGRKFRKISFRWLNENEI